jgi:hypothetical protein
VKGQRLAWWHWKLASEPAIPGLAPVKVRSAISSRRPTRASRGAERALAKIVVGRKNWMFYGPELAPKHWSAPVVD